MSISKSTLQSWYDEITNGIIETTKVGTINHDGNVKNGYNVPISNVKRVDGFDNTRASGYKFDEAAKALNLKYHDNRPDTRSKRFNGNTTEGNGDVPIPLNAANRDLEDLVTNFDVSRLPDYDNMATAFCGHLLFSRPSLYLKCFGIPSNQGGYTSGNKWDTDPAKNYFQFATESLTSGFAHDNIGRTLLHPLTSFSNNPYMPLFTSRALTYTTNDIQLKTIDKGTTYYGHTIKYGHYSEDHKAGGSITIEFMNDRYWSVLKTCFMWMAYIYMVSKSNVIRPSMASQTGGVLDYAGSIYYLVTDITNHRLVYWEKLTGVFPKSVPFSLFSTEDNQKLEANASIEFDYGIRSDPCDISVLMDINMLTYGNLNDAERALQTSPIGKNSKRDFIARPDNLRGGNVMARSNVEASRPVIRMRTSDSGDRQFYLEWLRRSTNGSRPYDSPISATEAVAYY